MTAYLFNVLFNSVKNNPSFEGYIYQSLDDIGGAELLARTIRKNIKGARVKRIKGRVYVIRKGE